MKKNDFSINNQNGKISINGNVHVGDLVKKQKSSRGTKEAAAPEILGGRAELRRKINQKLRTDEQLNAFILDFDFDIFQKFSGSMSRDQKLNLLLQIGDLNRLEEFLIKWAL